MLYAVFGVLTVFGTGNATQVNTITAAIDTALLEFGVVGAGSLPALNLGIGILVAMIVAMVLLGGIQRIGKVSEKLVPLMALLYILLSVGVVALNLPRLPEVLASIIKGAFDPLCSDRRCCGQRVPEYAEGRFPGHLLQRGGSGHGVHRPCLRRYQKAGGTGDVRHL